MKYSNLSFKLNFIMFLNFIFILSMLLISLVSFNKMQVYKDNVLNYSNINSIIITKLSHLFLAYSLSVNNMMLDDDNNAVFSQREAFENKYNELLGFEKKIESLSLQYSHANVFKNIANDIKEYLEISKELVNSSVEKKELDAYIAMSSRITELADNIVKNINEMGELNSLVGIDYAKQSDKFAKYSSRVIIAIFVLFVMSSLITYLYFRRSSIKISNSLRDLKEQIISTELIVDSFEKESTVLSKSLVNNEKSLETSSSAVLKIENILKRTLDNSRILNEISKNALIKTIQGQKTIDRVVLAVNTMKQSHDLLSNFEKIISKMKDKTSIINEIVARTELLSLNAAIESARAGETNKGFTIVAKDVANLAKMSSRSAREIQNLIITSQEQINQILEVSQSSIENGTFLADEAKNFMDCVASDISFVSLEAEKSFHSKIEEEMGFENLKMSLNEVYKDSMNNLKTIFINKNTLEQLNSLNEKLKHTSEKVERHIMGAL